MGTLSSKEVRRISFNNTFALHPAIVQQSIEEDENEMTFGIMAEELIRADNNKENKITDSGENSEINYWPLRIEKLKKEHQIINKIIETEYEKTIENNKKLYNSSKLSVEKIQKVNPCFDWRTKILQCYEDNPHQPLVCSPIVQAFRQCVASCTMEEN